MTGCPKQGEEGRVDKVVELHPEFGASPKLSHEVLSFGPAAQWSAVPVLSGLERSSLVITSFTSGRELPEKTSSPVS